MANDLTIAEASALTGMSKRALARRVERGQLRATKRGGLRYLDSRDLAAAGLLDLETGVAPAWAKTRLDPGLLAREVIETLIRQSLEIHELHDRLEALQRQSEAGDRELRARIERAREERAELRRLLNENLGTGPAEAR